MILFLNDTTLESSIPKLELFPIRWENRNRMKKQTDPTRHLSVVGVVVMKLKHDDRGHD